MLDRCHAIHIVPTRRDHPYSVLRGAGADVRIVHARQVKITHTFDDPEESDRRLLPVASRQPLGK
jgi:hypothetical protein